MLSAAAVVVVMSASAALPRVYVAPIQGEDRATARLVEDRVLVAARAFADHYDIVGARDVQGLLDVEAAKAAVGCDETSCADEIAGALNADQLITGQLGRIGGTWQLTLSRTDRKTLHALGRATTEAHGDTPEGLLADIPRLVHGIFDVASDEPSGFAIAGYSAAGVGAVGLIAGGALYALSWSDYGSANDKLTKAPIDVDGARTAKNDGQALLPLAYGALALGAVLAAAGATLLVLDAAEAP